MYYPALQLDMHSVFH